MATTKEKKNCENKKIKKDVLTRVHGYYQPGNEFDVFLPATAWRFIIFLASAARIQFVFQSFSIIWTQILEEGTGKVLAKSPELLAIHKILKSTQNKGRIRKLFKKWPVFLIWGLRIKFQNFLGGYLRPIWYFLVDISNSLASIYHLSIISSFKIQWY